MLGKIVRKALQEATRDSKAASAQAQEDGFPILAQVHQAAADDTVKRTKSKR
jgi:hypothetical protein